jgi:hypothetical protein
VTEPPWLIGSRVQVKSSDRKGHKQLYAGEIVSKKKPVLLENERDMLKDVSMHSKSDSGKSSRLPRAKNTQHKERVDVELLNKYRRIQVQYAFSMHLFLQ